MSGKSEKIDPRKQKTRKALLDALAELLTDKELPKVTVQEISDKAQVNRVTFYNHFLDVYDLNDQLENEVLQDMAFFLLSLEDLPSDKVFTRTIDYVDKNRTVFRLIFSPNGTGQLRQKLYKMIDGIFRQTQAEKQHSDLKDLQLEYLASYRSQGCLAVIARWVRGGYAEPKEFILDTLAGLDSNTDKYIQSIRSKK